VEHKILSISFVFSAIVILFLSLLNPFRAYGQSYSHEEGKKKISIDKKVRAIGDTQYFDNIEASRKTFFEKDVIEFQVRIENISTETVYNINTKDILPKYLGLIFYPGTFDNDQYIVEWNIDELKAGESKTYLIRAKINDSTKLNVLTKQTNKAEACGGGSCDVDYASYFIGKTSVPATGASDIAVKTILVALTATSGFYFRKLARGY
jgi:uncharacterized repeat protein (TIGR01451 family)